MDNKEYKYDAFISYRHCELDKFVAEKLHKILESYELPKNIKRKLNIKRKTIRRIFRDQEELPLSSNLEDPIIDALENSKFLIVICSPRLKDSLWCKKEIQTFKKLRGRKNIFCVLVEGEPSDSFPEEVLYDDSEKIKVEPLAADVRGKNKKEVLKKIKQEKLRLVAPMYNLDYDDLRQRHKQRKQKRILTISIIVAAFLLLFSLYTSLMLIKINSQQKKLKLHQANNLAIKSEDYFKKDSRFEAIKTAYEALTTYDGVSMPYTASAEYALVESLGIYDVGYSYRAIDQINTDGVVDYLKTSPDGKYGAIYDESGTITLFNTKNLKVISTYSADDIYSYEESFTFIGNEVLAFINDKGNINLVNQKGKKIKEIKKEDLSYISLAGTKDGNYLTYSDQDNLYIYDVKNDKKINSIKTNDKYLKEMYYSTDNDYIFVFTTSKEFVFNQEEQLTMHVISVNTGKEVNRETFKAGYVNGVVTKEGNAYILLNNYVGTVYNSSLVSYNYLDGIVNWDKTFDNTWMKYINKSYPSDTNDIALASYDLLTVINCHDGSEVETFNFSDEIIELYSSFNKEIYVLFLANGEVNYVNMEYRNNINYLGRYELNASEYTMVSQSENGFLLIPKNQNRVILYEKMENEDAKKVDLVTDVGKDEIKITDYDNLKEKYKVSNKNLVHKMFYDDKKELLFVSYTNEDLAIYNVKDRKLLKTLNNITTSDTYYGKDKYGRIYIGNSTDSYILDSNYDKVGHIKRLVKVKKNKVYVVNSDEYYELKIYSLDEILDEAKDYLK